MRSHVTASPAESIGRSGFRLLICFIAVIGVMAALVPSAFGAFRYPYSGTSFGPDGVGGSKTFSNLQGVAVDQTSGNVYAYDSSAGKIYKFNAAGEPVKFAALSGNVIEGVEGSGNGEEELAVAPAGSPGGTAGDIYAATNHAIKIFAPSGESLGELSGPEPCGVAVSPAGHVFVGEYPSTIRELVPNANPVTSANQTAVSKAPLSGICNVAADGLGNVFAAGYSGGEVVKLEGIADATPTRLDPGAATLTVNPTTNEVFANRGESFVIYDSAGNVHGNSVGGGLSDSRGIAINASSGTVYAGGPNHHTVAVFGPALTLPDATTGVATEIARTTAKVNGTVNPLGSEATYQFEYGTTTSYGNAVPASPTLVGSDSTNHQLSVELSGLEPDATYHFRIVATNANGTSVGEDRTFVPGVLSVETTGSPVRTASTVRFDSRVFVHGNPTNYYFEYGTQGPCDANPCTATDPQPAGSGNAIKLVSQMVEGLSPGTIYHYRVVANDGTPESPAAGADMTVTTLASDAPLSHGRLPGPPNSDRAWEQISMPDTGGNPIGSNGNNTVGLSFSENGGRAIFPMRGGTPTAETASAFSLIYSERTESNWQVKQITPKRAELVGSNWFPNVTVGTPDLSTVISANTNLGTGAASIWRMSPGAAPEKLYETGPGKMEYDVGLGLSANGQRIVAALGGELFDISSGEPQVASVLPDGQPCPGYNAETLITSFTSSTQWVTDDGSRMFFECGSGLYVHNFETDTSKSLAGGCSTNFIQSTPGAAFFVTGDSLTPDDSPSKGECGGRDVYRLDFGEETLDCLTCAISAPAEVAFRSGSTASIAAVSSDGSSLYFMSENALFSGTEANGIYRLDLASGDLAYVGSGKGVTSESTIHTNPDGSVVSFYSNASADNAVGGQNNGGALQLYRYDDRDRSLVCVSCPADGTPPTEAVEVPFSNETSLMSADGRTLAFVTPTPLSTVDQNTASSEQSPRVGYDVYEWRDGRQLLVTDGISEWQASNLGDLVRPVAAGVSPSGRDIYLLAPAQYTPDALDGYQRLYDARIGGGFEFPLPPKPCPLEVCQGTPKGAPEEQAPGTGTFEGATKPPARHKAKHRKKAKAHKKKHKSAKKTHRASNNRRTAR